MNTVKILLACSLCGACVSCAYKDTRDRPKKVYARTYNDAVAEGLGHESAQNRALLMQLENHEKPKGFWAKIGGGLANALFDTAFGLNDDSDEDFYR